MMPDSEAVERPEPLTLRTAKPSMRPDWSRARRARFAEEYCPARCQPAVRRHIAVAAHDPPSRTDRESLRASGSGASVRAVLLKRPISEMRSVFENAGLISGDSSASGYGSASGDGAAVDLTARTLVDSAIIGYDALLTPALLDTQCISIDDALKTAADSVVLVSDSMDSASPHMQALQPLLDELASRGILFVIAAESGGPGRLSEQAGGGAVSV